MPISIRYQLSGTNIQVKVDKNEKLIEKKHNQVKNKIIPNKSHNKKKQNKTIQSKFKNHNAFM